MQRGAAGEPPHRRLRKPQHRNRRIDAIEPPSRVTFGEICEFQAPAGADDQDAPVVRNRFGEDLLHELVHEGQTRHETPRGFGVTRDG